MSLAWSSVKALAIPVGGTARDVKRVSVGGVTLWEKASQIPYVTDGLVAWYDGIWNAGIGVHDASATTWKDLVGQYDLTRVSGTTFGDDCLVFNNGKATSGRNTQDVVQMEIVFERTGGERYAVILGAKYVPVVMDANKPYIELGGAIGTTKCEFQEAVSGKKSISAAYSGGCASIGWFNGTLKNGVNGEGWRQIDDPFILGQYPNGSYKFVGKIYAIRFYSRALTDAEVAANYAADKERFGLP